MVTIVVFTSIFFAHISAYSKNLLGVKILMQRKQKFIKCVLFYDYLTLLYAFHDKKSYHNENNSLEANNSTLFSDRTDRAFSKLSGRMITKAPFPNEKAYMYSMKISA